MPVRVRVIGSGSRGNCTAIWTDNTVLLVDAGRLAVRRIKSVLADTGLDVNHVNGVLVTHCHTDHLDDTTYRLCGRHGIPVYCSEETWQAALKKRSNRRLQEIEKLKLLRELPVGKFRIGDFLVKTFEVPHARSYSAGSPVGYTIQADGVKIAYATDLGHVTPVIEEEIAGADILLIESNHDVEMERNSGRPADTIKWILGDTGHLSNEQCANAIHNIVSLGGCAPKHVVLAHLSEECNLPELALSLTSRVLDGARYGDVNLIAAEQKKPTPVLSI